MARPKLTSEQRLRATVRRLRRNIRGIYRSSEPLDGCMAEQNDGGKAQEEHWAEMRRMLR